MNLKKYIENYFQSWPPKKPTLPNPQRRLSVAKNTDAPAKPDFATTLESKHKLTIGIGIGMGIALILVGFLGWLSVSYMYERFENFFLANGYDPNRYYLFRDLTDQIAIYLTLIATGVIALLWGALILKSRAVGKLFASKGRHARLGSGLIGGGGAVAFSSIRFLFLYILTSDYLELEIFSAFFPVGVILFACGILALKRK